jgi:hypothetical protein
MVDFYVELLKALLDTLPNVPNLAITVIALWFFIPALIVSMIITATLKGVSEWKKSL